MSSQLVPGAIAPGFSLPDANGREASLSDFAGRRLIVYFYPAAMTPGCTKQACDFEAAASDLAGLGLAVVGISPDKPAKLSKFRAQENLGFPLLSDPDKAVLTAYGAFGEKQLYGKTVTGVIRSTFLISVDPAGIGTVERAWYGVKATGHVGRLLRELA